MSQQDNFLKYALVFLLIVIMCLYYKQQSGFKNKLNNKTNNKQNNKTNNKYNTLKTKHIKTDTELISNNEQLCSNKRKCDLVEFTNGKHCLGPVRNFHQSFNKCNIKDLGWRKWWNKNMNKHNLCEPNNFQPIMKNFLKNQENTKNIYF